MTGRGKYDARPSLACTNDGDVRRQVDGLADHIVAGAKMDRDAPWKGLAKPIERRHIGRTNADTIALT